MGKKKLVIIAYISIVVILLSGIAGLSYAIYQAYIKSYTKYDVALFNAGIYGTKDENYTHQFNAFGENLLPELQKQANNLEPGMVKDVTDTALYYPFCVTNGTSTIENNVEKVVKSETSLVYEVRVRTSGNLPLKFTLVNAVTEGGNLVKKYYYADEPNPLTVTEKHDELTTQDDKSRSSKWYEYCFYDNLNYKLAESKFELQAGAYRYNTHYLMVEWPTTEEINGETVYYNIAKYMQEMDTIQIFISVYNKDDGVPETYYVDPNLKDEYGRGLIVLRKNANKNIASLSQEYFVSFKSFHQVFNAGSYCCFEFTVDNGVDLGVTPVFDSDIYTIRVKIPCYKKTYKYTVDLSIVDFNDLDEDGDTSEYITFDKKVVYTYEKIVKDDSVVSNNTIFNTSQYNAYTQYLDNPPANNPYDDGYILYKTYLFFWDGSVKNPLKVSDYPSFDVFDEGVKDDDEAISKLDNFKENGSKKDSRNRYYLTVGNTKGVLNTNEVKSISEEMKIIVGYKGIN